MKDVVILGRPIQLQERSKAQMKGVTIGDSLTYKFYDGEFHGLFPNTGLPLPFISAGTSAILSLYSGMGIVLNVRLQSNKYI